jgi:hypothetical protein
METQKSNMAASTLVEDDAKRDAATLAPEAASTGAGEKTGRNKGAVIGGAIGHAIDKGKDVFVGAVSAVKGGMAANKNAGEKAAADAARMISEHEFWRKEFSNRPYFTLGTPYEQYGPAFQYGWESCAKYKGKTFQEVEAQLEREWEIHRGKSQLSWNHVKEATRDAWQRVEKAVCGDSCH